MMKKKRNISNPNLEFESKKYNFQNESSSMEEENLMNEINDLKNNVILNWKTLNEFIKLNLNINNKTENIENELNISEKNEIEDLLNSCKSLMENNININEKIQKLKEENQLFTDISQQYQYHTQQEYENEKNKYAKLQIELSKKKSKLNELDKIISKERSKPFCIKPENEIYIIEPTRKNIEIHQEISSVSDAIKHLKNIDEENKIKLNQLKSELEEIENESNSSNIKKNVIIPPAEVPAAPCMRGTPQLASKSNSKIINKFNLNDI